MEKLLLSVASALAGFLLSQSFNFVSYLRRPRFRVDHWSDGVLTCYTASPPEDPWEIELGFYLKNWGKNPAKSTRLFVCDMQVSKTEAGRFDHTSIELIELRRPLDLIPPGMSVPITLGKITGDKCYLSIARQDQVGDSELGLIEADTRGCIRFKAKFYITCDEKNSIAQFTLEFRPDKGEWTSIMLEDYTKEYLDSLA